MNALGPLFLSECRADALARAVLICMLGMRSPRDIHPVKAYSVDVSPSAWGQLATLATEDYGRIRAKLDAIAVELMATQPPRSPGTTQGARSTDARAFVVEGYAVLYAVDTERGRITLLEVTRRISEEE